MSKIYRRPMFRGGGKVSSYGNGIATGLADGGRPGYETGGDIMSKISGANTLFTGDGRFLPGPFPLPKVVRLVAELSLFQVVLPQPPQ